MTTPGDYAVMIASKSFTISELDIGDVAYNNTKGDETCCIIKTDSLSSSHPYIGCINYQSNAGTSWYGIGNVVTGESVQGSSGSGNISFGDFAITKQRKVTVNNAGTYLYFQIGDTTVNVATLTAEGTLLSTVDNYGVWAFIRIA